MVGKFCKMTSPKAVCILFQALTAPIVIESFPNKLFPNEGLNSLPIEEAAVKTLVYNIKTKCEPVIYY